MKMAFSSKNLIVFNLFLIILFSRNHVVAQNPSTEFEIGSILVDGCDGGNEGKNEMVLFQNGPNPLNINNIRVDGAGATGVVQIGKWPNTGNSFLGFCTTVGATSNIATLNTAITQCGKLIEPAGGIIPKYGKVLIITSTDFTATPSYFANLTDTLYVVFQCAGNTAGHFVNYNSTSSTRTLILTNTVTSYRDTIKYDPSLLLNASGNPGAGDGGAVRYAWDGTPTYFNNGCQAPFIPLSISINPVGAIDCPTNSYALTGNVLAGSYKKVFWDGGIGSFSSPLSFSTSYTPGIGELGSITLRFNAVDLCNDTIRSLVNLTIYPQPISNAGNDTTLCSTIPGSIGSNPIIGSTYIWNLANGLSSAVDSHPSITLSNATTTPTLSTYILTATTTGTGCSINDTVNITVNPLDISTFSLSSTCDGATANVTGLSGGTFSFTNPPIDLATINTTSGTISNGNTNTNYFVSYTSNGVCPTTTNQSILSSPLDDANFSLTPNCYGATAIISGLNGGVFSFTTLPLDGATINPTSGTITNGVFGTSYSVDYTTNGSCPNNQTQLVVLPIKDIASFSTFPNCKGGIAMVNGTVNGIFSFTNPPSDNATINSNTGEITNGNSAQTYYLTYTTTGTCIDSKSDSIKVLTTPNTPLFNVIEENCSSENLPFIHPTTTLTDTTHWYSDINLLNLISTKDSIQLLNQIGTTTYFVTSILNGCESLPTSISATLNDCSIEIPTAFTPDGDLVNDQWELVNIDYLFPDNNVKIYNRWGYLIFESTNGKYEAKPWDGNFNGETMPVGSYYFIIEFNKNNKKAESGTVSIIR